MKNKFLPLLLVLAMLLCFAACGKTDEGGSAEGTIAFTDMYGRDVALEKPAERIVVLTAADCEILYAIGAGDRIIGRGEYCTYPAEAESVPMVKSGRETNIEQIISFAPDVVMMNKMDQTVEQMDALENAGIKVVVNDADDIEGVYKSIENVGLVTGLNAEAKALADEMRASFKEISELSTGDGSKTIYFEVSPLEYGLWAGGKNTFMHEIAGMLGLTNIFEDVNGWGQVSEEQVLSRNPDYIVTVTMFYDSDITPSEEIMSREGWSSVSAVASGNVLSVDSDELSRPGPRIAKAAREIYDFIYG
ncbi:MAG: ABC transporter substrate-binding protein [Oscillospiraceae bacterium]|nr:ABC transporter substrate-binding protein [Oscillospiraceae bacterium]